MIKIFDTLEKYNTYTNNGQNLESGFLYYVKEDNSTHYYTNNIDGVSTIYDTVETPSGNIEIIENGTNIDVAQYATATVNVAAQAKDYIVEGIEYDPQKTYTGSFTAMPMIISATIPNGFTSIGGSAFSGCSGLTSVTIPNSVTTIGGYAFSGCSGLTSITIPNNVTSIGDGAFQGCTGLTSLTIPSGVTSIGQSAFSICSGLTSITIPDSVTSIGNGVFQNCRSLTSVTFEATTPPTLGANAFNNTNNCPIYVPAESVDTYKAASGWSSYASRIQAIPGPSHDSPL